MKNSSKRVVFPLCFGAIWVTTPLEWNSLSQKSEQIHSSKRVSKFTLPEEWSNSLSREEWIKSLKKSEIFTPYIYTSEMVNSFSSNVEWKNHSFWVKFSAIKRDWDWQEIITEIDTKCSFIQLYSFFVSKLQHNIHLLIPNI